MSTARLTSVLAAPSFRMKLLLFGMLSTYQTPLQLAQQVSGRTTRKVVGGNADVWELYKRCKVSRQVSAERHGRFLCVPTAIQLPPGVTVGDLSDKRITTHQLQDRTASSVEDNRPPEEIRLCRDCGDGSHWWGYIDIPLRTKSAEQRRRTYISAVAARVAQ